MLEQTGARQLNQFLVLSHPEQYSWNRWKQMPSVYCCLECGTKMCFVTRGVMVEVIRTQLKPFLRSCGCCNFLRSDAYIRWWSLSWSASLPLASFLHCVALTQNCAASGKADMGESMSLYGIVHKKGEWGSCAICQPYLMFWCMLRTGLHGPYNRIQTRASLQRKWFHSWFY